MDWPTKSSDLNHIHNIWESCGKGTCSSQSPMRKIQWLKTGCNPNVICLTLLRNCIITSKLSEYFVTLLYFFSLVVFQTLWYNIIDSMIFYEFEWLRITIIDFLYIVLSNKIFLTDKKLFPCVNAWFSTNF